MKVNKYVSSKEVVNHFFRDSGNTNSISMNDISEWLYEVLNLINSPMIYLPKYIDKTINPDYNFNNFRVPTPCNLHSLIGVYVNGVHIPPSSNTIQPLFPSLPIDSFTSTDPYGEFTDYIGNLFTTNSSPTFFLQGDISYDINNSYITFNIKEGEATVLYYMFPLDEEGFPLIPDIPEVIRACTSYITHKSDRILWRTGIINDKIYSESKEDYFYNITQASNKLKMPSNVDEYESLKRSIQKMIVPSSVWCNNFKNLSSSNNRYI